MKAMCISTPVLVLLACCVQGLYSHSKESEYNIIMPDIELLQHRLHNREKRTVITNFDIHAHNKWPNPINYIYDSSLTLVEEHIITEVLTNDFEARTCIKFNRISEGSQSNGNQFIAFIKQLPSASSSCKSYIGRQEDIRTFHGQPVYLGKHCFELRGSLVHMIAATLGMYNGIQRPDRDDFIDIFWDNIDPNGTSNFAKQTYDAVVTHDVPYDYASAVHFRPKAWLKSALSTQSDKYTTLPKDRSLTHLLGQVSEISYYDVEVLNHAYCSDVCQTRTICLNDGYQDPKNCNQCLCPDGYSGINCQVVETGSNQCTPVSGKIDATEREKCISSPNYGPNGNYQTGDSCTWLIEAPPTRLIDMYFYESIFGLPYLVSDTDICMHWVEIKYKGLNATRGARFCSKDTKTLTPIIPTKSNQLTSQSSRVMVLFRAPKAFLQQNYLASDLKGFKMCFKISDTVITTAPPTATENDSVVGTSPETGLSAMVTIIIAVIVSLLVLLIIFAIVIIILLYRRRKKKPETVVVASGLNNPGYAEHNFPVVSFNNPNILHKKMSEFGASGVSVADLPPKYEDVPPGQAPAYTISGDYKDLIPISERPLPPEPDYEIVNMGNNLVPISERPVPPEPGMHEEPLYQNAGGVAGIRSRFEPN